MPRSIARERSPTEQVLKELEMIKIRRTKLDLMEKIVKQTIPHLKSSMHHILGEL